MIKAIVLDIDGVIVGSKDGENFPMPSKKISKILRELAHKGIPVSFCSAKSSFAVGETIIHVGLDTVHIADAGAVLFNPMQKKVVFEHKIPKEALASVIKLLEKEKTYTMLFTPDSYFLLDGQESSFTKIYTHHIGKTPEMTSDFQKHIENSDVVKIVSFVFDAETRSAVESSIKKLDGVSYAWSGAPVFDPAKALVVTAHGVSKKSGLTELSQYLKVPFENILGVGDSIQDWDFIEVCGYKGTLANASEELKRKFDFKDPHQCMGSHVNEDGLIDVLKHFKLIT